MTAAITNTTDSVNAFLTRLYVKTAARAAALRRDDGMSTIEYAMGSLAAAALAAVLYMVINGNGVVDAIEGIITDALSNTPS
ncbi:Protein of unknown function [Corynebacterium appendicis CIP 107643]|uniref:DUF4244 domain-containing protein n=1 Tax=Corynebacterium appendicis CIP 107643 TaxID=1161099 RepID=A0A1N7INK1_9CORY|nr:DUF4244 domain-containing protein [Corynebacterium appendicis]WJY60120.1 hypothetical protein CAPP_00840 [Corynebacterium appendicis CIP 107643]SIS38667.1 Protein of unknown function [Corynebacterium appendicis CIP 107643]